MTQTRSVIDSNGYLALVRPVGTPTTKATQPIATEANMPMIAPFTGAGFLRDPSLQKVINVRATYDAETQAWVDYLVDELGHTDIAILFQDDGFGRVGPAGVKKALEARGMSLVAEGSYTRNTVAVKTALLDIRKAKPQAVVMVGAYKPLAEVIKLSRKMKLDPTFVIISFVGSRALTTLLAEIDAAGGSAELYALVQTAQTDFSDLLLRNRQTLQPEEILSLRQEIDAAPAMALDDIYFDLVIDSDDAKTTNEDSIRGLMDDQVARIRQQADLNSSVKSFFATAMQTALARDEAELARQQNAMALSAGKLRDAMAYAPAGITENLEVILTIADPANGIAATRAAAFAANQKAVSSAQTAAKAVQEIALQIGGVASAAQNAIDATADDLNAEVAQARVWTPR